MCFSLSRNNFLSIFNSGPIGAIIVAILLCFLACIKVLTRDLPEYNVKVVNKIYPVKTITEPAVSSAALLEWVSLAVTKAYTMDFATYESTLEEIKSYFTKSGYTSFKNALESSDRISTITSRKLLVSAVVTEVPVIIKEGRTLNGYAWQVQLPLLLTYVGAGSNVTPQRTTVTVLVTRVPTNDAANGIGIAQITEG